MDAKIGLNTQVYSSLYADTGVGLNAHSIHFLVYTEKHGRNFLASKPICPELPHRSMVSWENFLRNFQKGVDKSLIYSYYQSDSIKLIISL